MMILLIYFLLMNVIAFLLMGMDKQKAKRHAYRISEAMLLLPAFLFGSFGSYLGMHFFHHKTKKKKFTILVPLLLLIQLLCMIYLTCFASNIDFMFSLIS